jgi:hypothetical protein
MPVLDMVISVYPAFPKLPRGRGHVKSLDRHSPAPWDQGGVSAHEYHHHHTGIPAPPPYPKLESKKSHPASKTPKKSGAGGLGFVSGQ